MVPILELWAPIAVSAVLVFVVSTLVHMVLGYHKSDYRGLEKEAEVLEALRRAGVSAGNYMFPHCKAMKELGSPEMIKKYEQGPVGMLVVSPKRAPTMGKELVLWFLYSVVVGVFVAYLAGHTLAAGTHYLAVFRVAGAAAFMAYAVAPLVDSIWKLQPWSVTLKHAFDGVLYSLVTAGSFGWLWPR
jgi:hypothetical protein